MMPATELTVCLPIHIVPCKLTFSTNVLWIFGAVSLGISRLDHLSLQTVWMWLIIWIISELTATFATKHLSAAKLRMLFQHGGEPANFSRHIIEYCNNKLSSLLD